MRVISLKRILGLILEKKTMFFVVMAICCILGLINSARTYKDAIAASEVAVAEYEQKLCDYNSNLTQQDETIATLKENLVSIREQYEAQEEYCNNSIYMALDANNIWVAEIHYSYWSEVNTGYTMNALAAYFDSVEMRNKLEESTGFEERYLKDILTYSFMGNVTRYYIYAPNEESAKLLLENVKKELDDVKPQIEEAQGRYSATLESEDVGVRADLGVQNAQNTANNNLRSYNTSLTDTQNAIESKQISRDNYARDNMPEVVYPMSKGKKIFHFVKGLILGAVLGIAILVIWNVMMILFGRRILDEESIRGRGTHVIYLEGKEENLIDAAAESISLCAENGVANKILILMLSFNESDCIDKITGLLSVKGIEAEFCEFKPSDAKMLATLGKYDGAFVFVKKGLSLHRDLDDLYECIDSYGINLLGGLYDRVALGK